jgi:hypothetical protein
MNVVDHDIVYIPPPPPPPPPVPTPEQIREREQREIEARRKRQAEFASQMPSAPVHDPSRPADVDQLLNTKPGNTVMCQRCRSIAHTRNINNYNVRYCDSCLRDFQRSIASRIQNLGLGAGAVLTGQAMFDNDPNSPPYSITLTQELIDKVFKPFFK